MSQRRQIIHVTFAIFLIGMMVLSRQVNLRVMAAISPAELLYIGGTFTSVDGDASIQKIATWNDTSWAAVATGGANGDINDIAVAPDGRVYAAGTFTTIGGVAANRIAVWDGVSWSPLGTGFDRTVFDLDIAPDGTVYAGGLFTSADGVPVNRVAAWDGTNWSALGGGANSVVYALLFDSNTGQLIVGGSFNTVDGGTVAEGIATWNSTTSTWTSLTTNGARSGTIRTFAIDSSGTLYAGGFFTMLDGNSDIQYIAAWDGASWTEFGTGFNEGVRKLAFDSSGNLHAVGRFTQNEAGTVTLNRVARWNGAEWASLGSGTDTFGHVYDLVFANDGTLYVGGFIPTAGGNTVNNVAVWNGSTWAALGDGTNSTVYAIAIAPIVPPAFDKQIVSSSEPDSSGDNALIGEVFTYRITYTVPEGTNTNVVINETIPAGMMFLNFSAQTTVNSDTGWTVTPTVTGGGAEGLDVTLDLGTFINTDSDANDETIEIEYDVLVNNVLGNQDGTVLTTSGQLSVNGASVGDPVELSVTVAEPNIVTDLIQRAGPCAGSIEVTEGDAGDVYCVELSLDNVGTGTAYDVVFDALMPVDYVDASCCTISGGNFVGPVIADGTTGEWSGSWSSIDAGDRELIRIQFTVENSTAPGDSWTTTANINYNSLPDADGTDNNVPGVAGTVNGMRDGSDTASGALNNYAGSAISPTFSVPLLVYSEFGELIQVEHPSVTPFVSDLTNIYGSGYTGTTYMDSTSDPNTGWAEYDPDNGLYRATPEDDVDITIGEEYSYLIVFTFPEGTTYDLNPIALTAPTFLAGGRRSSLVELLSAEVVYVGGNLSNAIGSPILSAGTPLTVFDNHHGDGDGDTIFLLRGAVLNTPDNVVDDNDRYVIRVNARLDDEDASGGPADDVGTVGVNIPNLSNVDGGFASTKIQLAWDDSSGTTYRDNPVTDVDIVEPNVLITKVTNTATDVDAGDTVQFTLTLQNTGTAPAYNITVKDTYPTLSGNKIIDFSSLDADASTCDGISGWTIDTPQPDIVLFLFDRLLSGQSCTITFNTIVQPEAFPEETYTNIASVSYSSTPGGFTSPDNRTYFGLSSYASTFTTSGYALTKTITATSETSTSDASLPVSAATPDIPVVIGEIVRYELAVTIFEGTSADLVITDTLNGNFTPVFDQNMTIEFVNDTNFTFTHTDPGAQAGFSTVDGLGIPLQLHNGTNFAYPTVVTYNSGPNTITFDIQDVVNNDTDANVEQIIIRFNALVENTTATNSGTVLGNQFTVTSDNSSATPTLRGTSNSVDLEVFEPLMTITKAVSPDFGVVGDTVTYTITVTNTGATSAFDVAITDPFDSATTTYLDLVSVTGITPAGGTAGITDNSNLAADLLDITVAEMPVGGSITITFDVTFRSIGSDTVNVDNTASAAYTSLPGPYGTTSNPTGSDLSALDGTTQAGITYSSGSGGDHGERDDSDVGGADTPDDYRATATETVTINNLTPTKSIIATSYSGTDAGDSLLPVSTDTPDVPVTVGEIVTYQMAMNVPTGTSNTLIATDVLDASLAYVANSAQIYTQSDAAMTFASIPGVPNVGPGIAIPGAQVNYAAGTNTLTITLGDVTNNDGADANLETVFVTFQAIVVDDISVIPGGVYSNTISLSTAGNPAIPSNAVDIVVQEPELTLAKVRTDSGLVDAGDTITYQVTLTHTAASLLDAFNVVVTDTLPADTAFGSITGGTCAGVTPNDLGTSVTFTVPSLTLAANSCTITYDVTVQNTVDSNTTISNSVVADYDTIDNLATARTKTTNTVSVAVTTAAPSITKAVNSTTVADTYSTAEGGNDVNGNGITDMAIGEEVTFALTATLMEGDDILTIIDTLPPGLTPLRGEVTVIGGNITGGNLAVGDIDASSASITIAGQDVTFNFGAVNNASDNLADAADQIIVTVTARVDDVAGNVSGTVLINEVDLTYNNTGLSEDNESVEIVGPAPNISKTFAPDIQVRGGATTITLVVSNLAADGASATLHDIQVTDILDDWLDVTGISVTPNATATTYGTVATNNSTITPGFASGVSDSVIIDIDALPVDGVVTIDVTVSIDPNADPLSLPRTITNTANLTGDTNAGNNANDRDLIDNASDDLIVVIPTLQVTKTDSADPVNAGDLMTYTVTIQNTGTPAFDATNVVFTDEFPAGFVVTLVTPSQGTCSPIVGGILTCTVGTIAQGNTATITITGRASSALADGTVLTNTAYVTSTQGNNGNDGNDTPADGDDARAEEPTTIGRGVDITVAKIVDNPNPAEGDPVNYTVDVTNNGPSAASNVVITDVIPSGLTFTGFVPGSLPCAYDGGTTTLTCTFTALAAGNSRTIGIAATVDPSTSGTTITNTASVASVTELDTNAANDSASVGITVAGVDIAVVKTVDNPTPNEGNSIVYSVRVTNNGPANATNLQITDDINGVVGITYVSDNSASVLDSSGNPTAYTSATGIWSIGQLDAGASLTLQITASVDAGASAQPQPIVNTATRTGSDQTDTNAANDSDTANIAVGGLDLAIQKGVNDATPDEGQTIVYTVLLTNNGAANATNVTVLDQLDTLPVTYASHIITGSSAALASYNPVTGEWTVPTLNANQSQTLQITVTVNAGTGGTGAITNTASITAVDQTDTDPTNDSDDATITVNTSDVAVVKTVNNGTPNERDTIIWSITVSNSGPSRATGVTVTDLLPAGVTYVSDNSGTLLDDLGSPTTYNSGTGVWTVGQLNSGSTLTLQITTTVDVGATALAQPITNTAMVTINETDTNAANDTDSTTISVDGLDLAVTKSVDNASPSENDTIVYSITVTNNGVANATNITVTDDLNGIAGLTYVSDNAVSILDSAASPTSYNSATGTWIIGALDAGQSLTLEITATVNPGTAGSSITNVGSLTAVDQTDNNTANNQASVTINVGAVDLAVTKVVDNSGPASGANVTYTISVTNNGPGTATGVTLNENLPLDNVNLTLVSNTPSQGTFTPNNPGPSVWDVGTLTSGQTATLQITVTVNIVSGSIVNTASVATVDQPDTDATNDSDSATIGIGGVDLAVTKTVNISAPITGDTVVYTITAVNNGPNTATGVEVLDILPVGITYTGDNAATLNDDMGSPTAFDSGSGDWTIGTLNSGTSLALDITVTVNISGGQVINTAEINGNEPDTNSTNDIDTATISVNSADLSVTKTINNNAPQVGDTITYTVSVSNAGPNTAFNVALTDQLPGGVLYVSDTASQGAFDSGTGVWTVGTLNVGQTANLLIDVQVIDPALGTTNTVEVTASDQSDPDSTPNNGPNGEDDYAESVFIFDPPFGVKSFNDSGLPNLNWTIEWANPSSSPVAVTVIDTVPAGTTFIPGTLVCSSPGAATNILGCVYDIGTNSIIVDAVVASDPGATPATIASATNRLIINFDIGVPATMNQVNNQATLTTSSGDTVTATSQFNRELVSPDDEDTGSTDSASIQIVKTANPEIAFAGETLDWVITLTNPSNTVATNLTVTDDIPPVFTVIDTAHDTGTVSVVGQIVTWSVGAVQPGETIRLTIRTQVSTDISETTINTAAVVGDNFPDAEADGVALYARELPQTGEASRSNRLPHWVLMLMTITVGAGGVMLRRYLRTAL